MNDHAEDFYFRSLPYDSYSGFISKPKASFSSLYEYMYNLAKAKSEHNFYKEYTEERFTSRSR